MNINQNEDEYYSSLLLKSTIDDLNDEFLNKSISFGSIHSSSQNQSIQNNDNKTTKNNYNSQKNSNIRLNNIPFLSKMDIKYLSPSYQFTLNEIDSILQKLKGHFFQLMTGKNSNYFISNIIINATKKQKLIILSEIYPQIDTLSISEYGSHPLQNLIEKASSKDEIIMIINAITAKNKFIEIAKDVNGTYVIQKIISYFNENFRTKVNQIILNNIVELCNDMFGVCVIKKFINNCQNQECIYFLLVTFINNFVNISENQFGNYAIQIFIDKIALNEKMLSVLEQHIFLNFLRLSVHRFGSRVIENYIEKLRKKKKRKILSILWDKGYIFQLIINKYGKYVISKLLYGFNSENRKNLLNAFSSIKNNNEFNLNEHSLINFDL
jgi:hypothetical protein